MSETSLQETYAPLGRCFGCGPANAKGLRIRSFAKEESPDAEVVCEWQADTHHEAFEGVLNGGIIGTLLDCHSNWTALWHLVQRDSLDKTPSMVTAEFHVKLRRPTSADQPVHISAHAVSSEGNKIVVDAELRSGDEVTASCRGTFVSVGSDHPAYGRW